MYSYIFKTQFRFSLSHRRTLGTIGLDQRPKVSLPRPKRPVDTTKYDSTTKNNWRVIHVFSGNRLIRGKEQEDAREN